MTNERIEKSMTALSGYLIRKIAQNTESETVRKIAIAEINRRNNSSQQN